MANIASINCAPKEFSVDDVLHIIDHVLGIDMPGQEILRGIERIKNDQLLPLHLRYELFPCATCKEVTVTLPELLRGL